MQESASGTKRTFAEHSSMSAFGVKRTSTRSIRYWRLSSDLVKRCNGKTLTRSVALPWHGKTVAH